MEKVINNTINIYGEIKVINGSEIQTLNVLDLFELEEDQILRFCSLNQDSKKLSTYLV